MARAAGHAHPFAAASVGVAWSPAATAGLVSTTIRSRPTRATSTATGRAPDDDRCSETVPPGSTDCGQQYPVTVSRGIGRTLITGLETGRGLPDRPPIDLRSTADGGRCIAF